MDFEFLDGPGISARQAQVARFAASGLTDKEIAVRLGLSRSTLRTHWERIRERLNAKSRTEAVARLSEERFDDLRGERDYLAHLLNSLPQFVWTADPCGHIDYCNAWFFHRGGLRPEESRGQGCRALMLEEDLPAGSARWRGAQETEQPYEAIVRFRCTAGEIRWHQLRLYPLRTPSGQVFKWVGTAHECLTVGNDEQAVGNRGTFPYLA